MSELRVWYVENNILNKNQDFVNCCVELTQEQEIIANSSGNLKINAVAGSGKTTTIIEYAKRKPADSKILYLAFNKSVKIEAEKKFRENNLPNVTVETGHSLAHRYIVNRYNYTVKHLGYKTDEIVDILGLKSDYKHAEFILANHIIKFVSYFCNSDVGKVEDLNYADVVFDPTAKGFVTKFYKEIELYTRRLLKKMLDGEIPVIHDFYLKLYQLSNPRLEYDYILFDEGQDASPAMLDVFLNQTCTKIIVGDTHQQIYGWRYAINSLEKVDFPTLHLSTSFRFGKEIAQLAREVLNWKNNLKPSKEINISGLNSDFKDVKPKTVLARTNLGLLLRAISYVTGPQKIKSVYFEGNIHSYTYADEGTSLYDVLNLYNGNKKSIRSKLIKAMNNIHELEDYIEKTEDLQLALMLDIVRQYGNTIYDIIQLLKAIHVEDGKKEDAEMIFSTVHRSKGMEYDSVQLASDFISEKQLKKILSETKKEHLNFDKINEDINVLYVAVTRTKNGIHIPENLIPEKCPKSKYISIIRSGTELSMNDTHNLNKQREETYSSNKTRKRIVTGSPATKKWSKKIDDNITKMFSENKTIGEIALKIQLPYDEIKARVLHLGLRK